ncbi:hypothetical protein GCM10009774_31580 [Cellulomonas gelida]|uniref:Uncharacterized protein n=1 Tax=Cellulomonas gelida TaxID=1712 RepID=A0A4Y3KKR1_9CELL|nr:hypothetical protein CGE01nite_18480 [Cellulomonas gelida]GGL38626.1 hypothetical protein GCM10009774_31580 [Cellulomonas gelida]
MAHPSTLGPTRQDAAPDEAGRGARRGGTAAADEAGPPQDPPQDGAWTSRDQVCLAAASARTDAQWTLLRTRASSGQAGAPPGAIRPPDPADTHRDPAPCTTWTTDTRGPP